MARLNEPLVPTDSFEILRRKFLRQNRDIARINSTQSLRIRSLENECARMLSENLELRGQILRLETELQDNRAHRVADHALAIKEKMEAQLLEWGTMLAGLGHEPIPRNRSPRATKKVKRSSIGYSNAQWRRRDSIDVEALALHEGRLPPIWETKSYPRETLNREEILAICSEAADNTDSPDLGPPPVSRFVDEDPVKIDLPVKASTDNSEPSTLAESTKDPVIRPTSTTHTVKKFEEVVAKESKVVKSEQPAKKEPKVHIEKEIEPRNAKPAPISEPMSPAQTVKPSLKRKSREEEESIECRVTKPLVPVSIAPVTTQPEKPAVFKDRPINRPMKELPSLKKDGRGKLKNATAAAGAQRKALGAKTTNENISSPKKATTKPNVVDEVAKAKSDAKRDEHAAKSRAEARKEKERKEAPAVIEISAAPEPAAPLAPVVDIEPTSNQATAETASPQPQESEPKLRPSSAAPPPESPAPTPTPLREEVRDTPPPLDISSRGETTRGSRRTRMTVSYAEPNLRDKMRRPTKQLFDAVAGEGKNQMRRASSQSAKSTNDLPTPASAMAPSSVRSSSSSSAAAAAAAAVNAGARGGDDGGNNRRMALPDMPASPLAQKTGTRVSPAEGTSSKATITAVASTCMAPPPPPPPPSSSSKSTNRRLDEIAAREAEVAKMFDGPDDDAYEIAAGLSPRRNSTTTTTTLSSRNGKTRRLSSIAREDLDVGVVGAVDEKKKNGAGGRKRASMMALGKSKMGVDDPEAAAAAAAATGHDSSSLEGDSILTASSADSTAEGASARERAASTRRRSMML